jgi:hypothetical protein
MYLHGRDDVQQHNFEYVQRDPYITGGNAYSAPSATDLVSAISSGIAALAALITLLTVWAAAIQIIQRRELYRLGTSKKSLGPWKEKVVAQSFSKMMQTKITTPTISLPKLVKSNWNPQGIVLHTHKFGPRNLADDEQPVEASWVNFLDVLTINPAESSLYTMQAEPELVNGIVPMRWKGSDLVAICSMLCFQSVLEQEKDALIHFKPMALPSQWHGPLGWIQFRASSDGCIAEYRKRTPAFKDMLTPELHLYYSNSKFRSRHVCLKTRAWNSINGWYLPNDKPLYIGGSSDSRLDNKNSDKKKTSTDKICDQVMEGGLDDNEIRRLLWGKKKNHPDAIRTAAPPESQGKKSSLFSKQLDEFLGLKSNSAKGKLEVLTPCPGLLSKVVQGELIISRGLNPNDCRELHRTYVDPDDWDREAYPYKIGDFRMAEAELIVLKEAYLQLKPDGFYWSPSKCLRSDTYELMKHIDPLSDDRACTHVISEEVRQQWKDYIGTQSSGSPIAQLYYAMLLCDNLQNIKVSTVARYTIADMGLISKASVSLRGIVGNRAQDLIWAMIASPELVSDLFPLFKTLQAEDVCNSTVKCQDGTLDCMLLMKLPDSPHGSAREAKYKVPLLKDGEFSGIQLLAAFFDVFVTYFWIEESVITNVALYDATIPNSITMC